MDRCSDSVCPKTDSICQDTTGISDMPVVTSSQTSYDHELTSCADTFASIQIPDRLDLDSFVESASELGTMWAFDFRFSGKRHARHGKVEAATEKTCTVALV